MDMEYDILFVDDDENIRNVYVSILKKHQYRVSSATSGKEALDLLESHSYRLVFLDINMPEMSGLKVLREIREKDRNIPIFIVTAFENTYFTELTNLRDSGIRFQILRKPILKDVLLSVADSVLLGKPVMSGQTLTLKLYIVGRSRRMDTTIDNLHEIIQEKWVGEYSLEVIDLLESPELAEQDQIFTTPTLCKISPAPAKRLIGDLGLKKMVLSALGL
jgi:CheY-like chemotaxis protein